MVYLGCVRFIFEAHCKSLMDLGTWDCIQFPLCVIVGEKLAVASDCKLMERKLTGFPAAALAKLTGLCFEKGISSAGWG